MHYMCMGHWGELLKVCAQGVCSCHAQAMPHARHTHATCARQDHLSKTCSSARTPQHQPQASTGMPQPHLHPQLPTPSYGCQAFHEKFGDEWAGRIEVQTNPKPWTFGKELFMPTKEAAKWLKKAFPSEQSKEMIAAASGCADTLVRVGPLLYVRRTRTGLERAVRTADRTYRVP